MSLPSRRRDAVETVVGGTPRCSSLPTRVLLPRVYASPVNPAQLSPMIKTRHDSMHEGACRFVRRLATAAILSLALLLPSLLVTQTAAPGPQRQTSTPYTGDLSIFETPGRDERLQINRVMDLLGIQPGRNVADIG